MYVCIRGVAGEPAGIKCTLSGSSKVRMGQKVDGDIEVSVRDKHGNEIKKVPMLYRFKCYFCFSFKASFFIMSFSCSLTGILVLVVVLMTFQF